MLDSSDQVSYDRIDERSLVDAARHDANAFAALYRRYVERIYAYAYRRTSARHLAEDVTSATFEKALRGLHTYRWREPGIGPWLFRIASNELVEVYRGAASEADKRDAIADGLRVRSVAEAETLEDRDEVRQALAQLRPRYQRALTLRYFADLSNEEAAEAMKVSRATMAVIVHRGTVALRKAIESARTAEAVTHGR